MASPEINNIMGNLAALNAQIHDLGGGAYWADGGEDGVTYGETGGGGDFNGSINDGGGTQITNNFNVAMNKNDVANVVQDQARMADRG